MGFHGALEVGGAMFSLASPLLVIIFTMMMMPSGGATYVFSGKDADTPFFLVKAKSRAHATPSPHGNGCGVRGWRRRPTSTFYRGGTRERNEVTAAEPVIGGDVRRAHCNNFWREERRFIALG